MQERRSFDVRETGRLGAQSGLRRHTGRANAARRGGRPCEARFVKVYIGCGDNTQTRNIDIEGSWRVRISTEIDAYPIARIHSSLGDSRFGLDGECLATERHTAQDGWLVAGDDLVGRLGSTAGWRRSAIWYVHGVTHSIVPKVHVYRGGNETGTSKLRDRANGTLGPTVEFVHTRRATEGVYTGVEKEIGETG
eukprot:45557-Pleurochrysis_carterae.AAC.2